MGELDGTELVHWRELPPAERRTWWESAWDAAIMLSARYRLALRRGWWNDALQVEALAAFHAWLRLYDTGAYTDPPGKLQLLWELERLRAVIRAGETAFDPASDRVAFEQYVDALEHPAEHDADDSTALRDQRAIAELSVVTQRLAELREREALLHAGSSRPPEQTNQPERDLRQLRAAIEELTSREHELRAELSERPDSPSPA